MVDSLRFELTQVIRKCKGATLDYDDLRDILNGKFKNVIAKHEVTKITEREETINLDTVSMPPPPAPEPIKGSLGDYEGNEED